MSTATNLIKVMVSALNVYKNLQPENQVDQDWFNVWDHLQRNWNFSKVAGVIQNDIKGDIIIGKLVNAVDMQKKRLTGEFHITAGAALHHWNEVIIEALEYCANIEAIQPNDESENKTVASHHEDSVTK